MILGTWAEKYNGTDGGKLYLLDGNSLELVSEIETGKSVSSVAWDPRKRLLFVTCETNYHGRADAGGEIQVYQIDKEAKGVLVKRCSSFGGFPIGVILMEQYVLVLNHGSNLSKVCITYRDENGELVADLVSDEAGLCLFERGTDGLPGRVADQHVFRGCGILPMFQESTAPHELYGLAEGGLIFVPLRGKDQTEIFRIDEAAGCIVMCGIMKQAQGTGPRNVLYYDEYCYVLSEIEPVITVFGKDGVLLQEIRTVPENFVTDCKSTSFEYPHPSGIAAHGAKKRLYTVTRTLDILTVFAIGTDGRLWQIKVISIPGRNPRQILIEKDKMYLICMDTENLLSCMLDEDGMPGDFTEAVGGLERIAVMKIVEEV